MIHGNAPTLPHDARPCAAATTDHTGCVHLGAVEGIEAIAAAGSNGPTEVVYLYAGPAPSPQTHLPGFIEINFNESVTVRLTEEGRRILAEKHEELRQRFPKIGPYTPKRQDEEGRVSFQFWDLMRTFGQNMFLGNPRPPIEGDIRFNASKSSWRDEE